MKKDIHIADTYYGSREALLDMIYGKVTVYLPILRVFLFLKLDGLRPGDLRDAPQIADFTGQVAEYCLATYDPREPVDSALERCIVAALRRNAPGVDDVDPGKLRGTESV